MALYFKTRRYFSQEPHIRKETRAIATNHKRINRFILIYDGSIKRANKHTQSHYEQCLVLYVYSSQIY